jgi:hypothetical protein
MEGRPALTAFPAKKWTVFAGKSNSSNPPLADSFVISADNTPNGMQALIDAFGYPTME